MSIRPPSDLVLDVVRAADPARAAAAAARLDRAESAAPFDAAMQVANAGPAIMIKPPVVAPNADPVGRGLEELLMRQLLQDALPKKAASVYGAGTAGDVWRGLFAEQLAHALAGAGRVGLASRLVKQGAAA